MADLSYHVVKSGKKWAVKKAGASRATALVETQTLAISCARMILRKSGGFFIFMIILAG